MIYISQTEWSSSEDLDLDEYEIKCKGKGDVKMIESYSGKSYFKIGAVVFAGILIGATLLIFDFQLF